MHDLTSYQKYNFRSAIMVAVRGKIENRLTIINLFSIYVFVQRLLNYYPSYSTLRLYFGEVETSYRGKIEHPLQSSVVL